MNNDYWYYEQQDKKRKSKTKRKHYLNMLEYEMIKNKEIKNAKEIHYLNR